MSIFTSTREKRLWLWSFLVFVAIYSTLFIGRPFANQLRDQNIQAIFFTVSMALIGLAVILYGLKNKPGKVEFSVLLGIIAVYCLFIFRLGAAERSHVIEYSILAIFIHMALEERSHNISLIQTPSLLALIITISIGVTDECIQLILPNRVYDPQDILFNSIAATMAIGSVALLALIRKRLGRSKNNDPI